VLVLDVNEAEAHKILLTHDPLAAMATASEDHVRSLLAEVQTENAAVRAMMDSLGVGCQLSGVGREEAERPEVNVPESYQVVIECHDEQDQQVVFERMRAEGYRCRVLTL
jgi:hypothetical protein